VLRLLLRERYLVSRDLAPSQDRPGALPGRAVAFGASETLSVMVNEEDHLRLQSLSGGYSLDEAWRRVSAFDRQLEAALPLAHSTRLGYLTSCPTNVGTGLRASVMLHLPALSLVKSELEKVFAAAQRTGLAVRGMHGEGSRAAGDLYQISNQVTLGRSEAQLVSDLQALVPCIVDFERRVREVLRREQRAALLDRISRSYGMLRTARAMATEAALTHLSMVRLGECLELVRGLPIAELNQITVQIQRGHIQMLTRDSQPTELIDATERDRLRATYLRRRFAAG
jgi:protein arginine kinase